MNRAQKNICTLAEHIPKENTKELEFLRGCYRAWSGYEDSSASWPVHQLRGLEKRYTMTMNELKAKYRVKI